MGNNPVNYTDPMGLEATSPLFTQNSTSYPMQVAMGPGALAVPGMNATDVVTGGVIGGGYQGLQPKKRNPDGYEAQLGLPAGTPPSVVEQIGTAIGRFVNGAISGAANLGNLIFNQQSGGANKPASAADISSLVEPTNRLPLQI